jgi:hypothetical protein
MKLVITPMGNLAMTDEKDYYIIDGVGMLWGIVPGFTSSDFDYCKN